MRLKYVYMSEITKSVEKFNEILLTARSGFTIPLNTVASKIVFFDAQPEKIPPIFEDIPNINAFTYSDSQETYRRIFPSLFSVTVPNIDNSFKSVLNYGEECASKYSQILERFFLKSLDCLPNSCNPYIAPTFTDTNLPIQEPPVSIALPSTSSGLRLPLPVTSSLTPLEPLILNNKVFDTCLSPIPSCSSTCYELFSSPEVTPGLPLFEPSTVQGIKSALDLAKPPEIFNCLTSPAILSGPPLNLPAPTISPGIPLNFPLSSLTTPRPLQLPVSSTAMIESPMKNVVSPLVSPCPIFSLPLSVISRTKDIKPAQLCDCSLPSSTTMPSLNNNPISISMNSNDLFIQPPNTLLYPSIDPVKPSFQEVNTGPLVLTESPCPPVFSSPNLYPSLIKSEPIPESCPIVPTILQTPVIVSQRGFYKGSTNIASLGSIFDSPLYRNCHTLKPLPVPYTNTLTSMNSLPNVAAMPSSLPIPELPPLNSFSSPLSTPSYLPTLSPLPLSCLSPTTLSSYVQSPAINSFSNIDDYYTFEPDFESLKQSPLFEVSDNTITSYNYPIDTDTDLRKPARGLCRFTNGMNTKTLLELISLVEMLNFDDSIDMSTLNIISSMLTA